MAHDPGLAQRVREVLAGRAGVSERAMFGGPGVPGGWQDVRRHPQREPDGARRAGAPQDALAMPGVRVMDFTGRPMKGYAYIDPPAISADQDLRAWVSWCVEFVARLPSKAKAK